MNKQTYIAFKIFLSMLADRAIDSADLALVDAIRELSRSLDSDETILK